MALIGKLELLLVSTVLAGASSSSCANSACLRSSFSGMHSTTRRASRQSTSRTLGGVLPRCARWASSRSARPARTRWCRASHWLACGSTTVTRQPPRASTMATSAPMVPPPTTTAWVSRGEEGSRLPESALDSVMARQSRQGVLIRPDEFFYKLISHDDQLVLQRNRCFPGA